MSSLQHHSIDALIQSGFKYDGNNMVIENVIFEVDQLKTKVEKEIEDLQEDYKFLQKVKNKQSYSNVSQKFYDLIEYISKELFDDFTYSESTTSHEEVEWKEYFHCVYEHVVPDATQPHNNRIWEILPEPPTDLNMNYTRWPLINSIKNNFVRLKVESKKSQSLKEVLHTQINLGKEMFFLRNEIIEKSKTLSTYYRIIEWSMY